MEKIKYYVILVCLQGYFFAAPVVQKVCNDTDFGYYILLHGDSSECTLHNKSIIIHPKTIFLHEFLLEKGQQGLILRPVFYKDSSSGKIFWLVNQDTYEYDQDLVKKAYNAWKKKDSNRKYKNGYQVWLDEWIGQDISVAFDPLELFGYLLDLSRIRIKNFNHQHVQWLSFAKGIFSKLILNFKITTLSRKGIIGKVSVGHGQGGICSNGLVERI